MLVADREGRQLFSSVSPDTASLPPRNNRASSTRSSRNKKPVYSNLFVGAVKKRMIVTVEVPVIRDGEVLYDISFSPPIEIFQAMIEQQRPGQDWTISIFDGEGINFARVPNPQETIGKRASPSLLCRDVPPTRSHLRNRVARGRAADHQRRTLLAYRLDRRRRASPKARWSRRCGEILRSPASSAAVLLSVGLAFAVRMATTIARGEMLHGLLIDELNHRVKNTLAIMQSIAAQTFRSASRAEREKFEGRLGALAEAHNLLSQERWQDSDLQDIVARVLNRICSTTRTGADVRAQGPAFAPARGGAVDDLARDRDQRRQIRRAVERQRHGHAGLGGCRRKRRAQAQDDLDRGGGPHVTAPVQRGFGSRLIERSARDQLGGEATVDFLPRGVVCTVTCALDGAN